MARILKVGDFVTVKAGVVTKMILAGMPIRAVSGRIVEIYTVHPMVYAVSLAGASYIFKAAELDKLSRDELDLIS